MQEQENLHKMEKFFKYNIEIKKILFDAMPKETDKYNKDTIMDYSDKLFKAINDIEYYIENVLDSFSFSKDEQKYFKKYIKAIKHELIKCGYHFDKLKAFYETCFSNMREELVNEVGANCVGYKIYRGVSLTKAKSLNEFLHVVHQTVINDENNLTTLPKLQEKQNKDGYPISLYGYNTELSEKVFNEFPLELSCGWTEIVSLSNNNIIMMVRDRGHALSIEIEKENDKYYVKYFIPKICNMDMVNKLNGVRKVTNESKFTTGIFESDLEHLSFELIDFIGKVPTDSDSSYYLNQNNEVQRFHM